MVKHRQSVKWDLTRNNSNTKLGRRFFKDSDNHVKNITFTYGTMLNYFKLLHKSQAFIQTTTLVINKRRGKKHTDTKR